MLLAVLEDEDAAAAERQRRAAGEGPRIEVLDRRSYDTIQRLTGIGALQTAAPPSQELHRSPRLAVATAKPDRQRLAKGAEFLGNAERKLRMALLSRRAASRRKQCRRWMHACNSRPMPAG